MTTQEEFPLSIRKSWKPSTATDWPFGDGGQRAPDKRPRLQLRMWSQFGIPARKITASLKGTLSKFRGKELKKLPGSPAPSRRKKTRRD